MGQIMRHQNLVWIILVILFMAISTTAQDKSKKTEKIAVITLSQGECELLKPKSEWAALKFGAILDDGDKIRTGADGFVALIFMDDRTQVKIRPNTEITITAKRNEDFSLTKQVNMEIGELLTEVSWQKGSFAVGTPTSVATVKGTEFWVVVNPDGSTTLLTLEGIVDFLNSISGINIDVTPGQQGNADEDGNLNVDPFTTDDLPDFITDEGTTRTIEVEYQDENGNTAKMIINVNTPSEDE